MDLSMPRITVAQANAEVRAMIAEAAREADAEARCHWCADTRELSLGEYEHSGRVLECVNASMCHARVEEVTGR
jgi:hypothetical protein